MVYQHSPMKRIALTLLTTSVALINFAVAQDERPAPVDRHNVARRQAPPQAARSMPPQAQQRSTSPRFQQPSFRAQQPQQPRFSPRSDTGFANRPRFDGQRFNGNGGRSFQPIIPTTGVTGGSNVAVPTSPVPTTATPDWRNRGGRMPGWRNRNTTPTGDQSFNGRNGGRGDWRNRTGADDGVNDGVNRNTTPTGDQNFNGRNGGRGDWRNRTGRDPGSSGYNGGYTGGDQNWNHGDRNWNHDRNHHRRDWWRSRYNRFALFGGGYYYLNSGYWYPAYGYDPYFSTYSYDAPIYSYNDQDPGQVMSDVQAELARRGYYYGAIDGTYGPQTRAALLRYQRENGLATTGMVDQPTLESLGYQ